METQGGGLWIFFASRVGRRGFWLDDHTDWLVCTCHEHGHENGTGPGFEHEAA